NDQKHTIACTKPSEKNRIHRLQYNKKTTTIATTPPTKPTTPTYTTPSQPPTKPTTTSKLIPIPQPPPPPSSPAHRGKKIYEERNRIPNLKRENYTAVAENDHCRRRRHFITSASFFTMSASSGSIDVLLPYSRWSVMDRGTGKGSPVFAVASTSSSER
ncbi:Hypothetical predicted protein, partial [Olea europaea subsp. europaea]